MPRRGIFERLFLLEEGPPVTSKSQPNERVSRELNGLLCIVDRLGDALEERGYLPVKGDARPIEPARFASVDELLATARALWSRSFHPPLHEKRDEEGP